MQYEDGLYSVLSYVVSSLAEVRSCTRMNVGRCRYVIVPSLRPTNFPFLLSPFASEGICFGDKLGEEAK